MRTERPAAAAGLMTEHRDEVTLYPAEVGTIRLVWAGKRGGVAVR